MDTDRTLDIASDFNRRAPRYTAQSWWVLDPDIADGAISLLREAPLGDVLDAGGGTGALAAAIADALEHRSVLVMDASEAMLRQVPNTFATRHSRIEDLKEIDEFDTILLRQVLHYTQRPEQLMSTLRAALRSAGRLYVGQVVAPNAASAEWVANIGSRISPNRRRVWTVDSLVSWLLENKWDMLDARLQPFPDDVRTLVSRRVIQVHREAVIEDARATLTPGIAGCLRIDAQSPALGYQLGFFHGVFRPV